MFGKLMKYELRHLMRIFAPMWAVVLILCVLSRLTVRPDMDGVMYAEGMAALVPIVLLTLSVFGILTMMIVAAVVLIQRFYKGMYGDEGYLMFTLPVTTGQLVNAKALSALLLMVATELVTVLGIAIMVSYGDVWKLAAESLGFNLRDLFNMLLDMYELTAGEFALMTLWGMVLALMETLRGIFMVYLAVSIGQLWRKHPIAGGILGWYVLVIVIGMLDSMIQRALGIHPMEIMMEDVMFSMQGWQMMLYGTVESVVLSVAMFFGTKLILDKKLNIM